MKNKVLCEQANKIDLINYLSSLGHYPKKNKNKDYWYLSPFREEKTASFKVNRDLNVWYDHGIGMGGNLVDFGLLYFRCSVSESGILSVPSMNCWKSWAGSPVWVFLFTRLPLRLKRKTAATAKYSSPTNAR